jgi:hypothetical protein
MITHNWLYTNGYEANEKNEISDELNNIRVLNHSSF